MSDSWMFPNVPAMGSGAWFNPGTSGLGNAQASYNNNQNYFANQARTLGEANAFNPFANTPGGFGGQTAAYAGLGAAYGRGTSGFGLTPQGTPAAAGRLGTIGNPGTSNPGYLDSGAAPSVGYPSGSVVRGLDLPNLSPSMSAQPGIPYLGSPAGQPFGGNGFGRMPTVFDTGTSGIPGSPPPGSFSPSPNYLGGRGTVAQTAMPPAPDFNNAFRQFGMSNPQMQTQDAFDTMRRFNGVGTGVSADAPAAPAVPSSPGADFNERFNIESAAVAGAPGSFADRFAAGRYFQPGTPSEYTTAPYQDAGGTMRGPMQTPPGVSTPYSFDNPGGALGRGGLRGAQAPIMNADDDNSQDTLTAQDAMLSNPFDAGARHIGPTMGPFMSAQAGGGVGRGTAPSSFAPSSPSAYYDNGAIANGVPSPTSGPTPTHPMGSIAAFNSYGLPGGGGIGALGGRGRLTTATGSIGVTPGDMSNFVSPSNNYNTFQRGASYPWTQQVPGNDPNIMNAVYGAAGEVGSDPAALAGMVNTESRWSPKANMGKYFGATQMGPDTFREAGGRLGGMTFDQYKDAPLEKQIAAYPDWQRQYNIPAKSAAISFGSQSPPVQAALLQAFQFAPNASSWQRGFAGGNTSLPITAKSQADVLSYVPNTPPTMGSMIDYYRRTVGR